MGLILSCPLFAFYTEDAALAAIFSATLSLFCVVWLVKLCIEDDEAWRGYLNWGWLVDMGGFSFLFLLIEGICWSSITSISCSSFLSCSSCVAFLSASIYFRFVPRYNVDWAFYLDWFLRNTDWLKMTIGWSVSFDDRWRISILPSQALSLEAWVTLVGFWAWFSLLSDVKPEALSTFRGYYAALISPNFREIAAPSYLIIVAEKSEILEVFILAWKSGPFWSYLVVYAVYWDLCCKFLCRN